MNDTQAQARPKRPALEEVEAYVRGKGYDDRGSANAFYGNFFYAYHDARAWRRADGTPVLDWRAEADAWHEMGPHYLEPAHPAPAAAPTPTPTAVARAAAPYRAVWVSYLEWEQVDFSSAEAFTQAIGTMLDNIQSIGATVVLAQVRPFGDALYPSDYFPFSHLCTGTQGQDPGFDPLAQLVAAAHARDLQLEAWVNPYRIQAGQTPALCGASPARLHLVFFL